MIPFRWLGVLLAGDPNGENESWHRFLPLLPWVTGDKFLVLPFFPVWRRYYPSTDWEGSNWGYGYLAKRPVVGNIDTSHGLTIGGTISRLLWLTALAGAIMGMFK
jgi:hypothetical protein